MDLDKLRSISVPRRLGKSERRVQKVKGSTVIETEHWDGKQDATVRPDVVRYGGRVHKTGKRKGTVAEVKKMTSRERRERHGESR